MKLTKERRINRDLDQYGYFPEGKTLPSFKGVDNSGGRYKYLRGEEYRPNRNPGHFQNAGMYENNKGVKLMASYDNTRSNIRQSMDVPSEQLISH